MQLPALWQKNVRSLFRLGDRDDIFIQRHAVSCCRKERLEAFQDIPLRGAQAVLLGDRHATTRPVAVKIAPEILGQRTETPFYFLFGVMRISLAFWAVQNIAKSDVRTPGWLGCMLRTSRHPIVIDCREEINRCIIVRCLVWGFALP